jgi:hypothetical protein
MVDFAHVVETTDGTTDVSYLKGVETLLKCFQTLVSEGERADLIRIDLYSYYSRAMHVTLHPKILSI